MVRPWLLVLLLCGACGGARILVFYPGPSGSLLRSFSRLFLELAHRGHQVTIATAYSLPDVQDDNIQQVLLGRAFNGKVMSKIKSMPLMSQIYYYWGLAVEDCENLLSHQKTLELINSNQTFDLFIGSPFYFLECSIAISHHLKIPALNIYSNRMPIHNSHLSGHLFPYSYVAEFNLPFGHNMNFWQRLINVGFCFGYSVGLSTFYIPWMDAVVKRHFPHLPPLQEMLTQVPVTLLNTNLAVHPPQPLMPGVIPVAGLTISDTSKLPNDLQAWMNESDEGVILFSLGSNQNMTSLDPDILRTILASFRRLPQRVLMKWEVDHLEGKPDNVRIAKWIPQAAVLIHRNCRLLMFHGGLHSWMEAVHAAVPLLGLLPTFFDQTHNLQEMSDRGHGRFFSGPWTHHALDAAITDVLHNPKYRENIQKASKVFWDRPMNPLQNAVFWTEYVIRYRGAQHLISPSATMPWYKAALLDVIGSLILALLLFVLVTCAVFRAFKRWTINYEYSVFNFFLRVCHKLKRE